MRGGQGNRGQGRGRGRGRGGMNQGKRSYQNAFYPNYQMGMMGGYGMNPYMMMMNQQRMMMGQQGGMMMNPMMMQQMNAGMMMNNRGNMRGMMNNRGHHMMNNRGNHHNMNQRSRIPGGKLAYAGPKLHYDEPKFLDLTQEQIDEFEKEGKSPLWEKLDAVFRSDEWKDKIIFKYSAKFFARRADCIINSDRFLIKLKLAPNNFGKGGWKSRHATARRICQYFNMDPTKVMTEDAPITKFVNALKKWRPAAVVKEFYEDVEIEVKKYEPEVKEEEAGDEEVKKESKEEEVDENKKWVAVSTVKETKSNKQHFGKTKLEAESACALYFLKGRLKNDYNKTIRPALKPKKDRDFEFSDPIVFKELMAKGKEEKNENEFYAILGQKYARHYFEFQMARAAVLLKEEYKYTFEEQEGEDEDMKFKCNVTFGDVDAEGFGPNKMDAKSAVLSEMLDKIEDDYGYLSDAPNASTAKFSWLSKLEHQAKFGIPGWDDDFKSLNLQEKPVKESSSWGAVKKETAEKPEEAMDDEEEEEEEEDEE